MSFEIVKYNDTHAQIWDNFVMNESINGTIYNTRLFLSTHETNKFTDASIMINYKKQLVAVIPCNKENDKYFSHGGCTYGGIIIAQKINNIKHLYELVGQVYEYYNNAVAFRMSSDIYASETTNILRYLLNTKTVCKNELSWYIETNSKWYNQIINKDNSRLYKKYVSDNNRVIIASKDIEYETFYDILCNGLINNHKTRPTHNTIQDFMKFKTIMKDYHKLYINMNNNIMVGGVIVIMTNNNCWYIFYIGRDIEIKNSGIGIINIMEHITIDANKAGVKYVDYGTSTENSGQILNLGLSEYKEKSLNGIPHHRTLFI